MSQQIVVWFGASQTCKSSAIKLLTGDQSIVCGELGKGASTTYDIRLYHEIKSKMNKDYLHIDTIGFGDTRLKIKDDDIRNKVQLEILKVSKDKKINSIKAIILTESLAGDSEQFSKNLLQITKIFGYSPSKSIVVLGTKKEAVGIKKQIAVRQDHIKRIMADFGIPIENYLPFSTPFEQLDEKDINQDQFPQLQMIINRCQPVNMISIAEKQQKINALALKIQKEKLKTVQIQVNQDRIMYRTEKQAYTIDVPRQKWKGDFGHIFGVKKTVWEKETRYHDIQVPYTVTQKVKKNVTVQQQFGYCYNLALEQYEKKHASIDEQKMINPYHELQIIYTLVF